MEQNALICRVSKYIANNQLIKSGDRVVVGFSGGADSLALVTMLMELGECQVIVAHCNFHLRGEESMRDERFVRDFIAENGIEGHFVDFDVDKYINENGVSVEMACRELRYDYFARLLIEVNANSLAVAHHSDDNAETMLLNLLRGTGLAGLCGMQPRNGNVIRPLLSISRCEIEGYLSVKGLTYVNDSTNAQNDYKRNVLRNVIIPTMRSRFESTDRALATTIDHCNGAYAIYRNAVEEILSKAITGNSDGVVYIDCETILTSPSASTILYEAVKDYGFNSAQVSQIIDSIISNSVGASYLSATHQLVLSRGRVEIAPIEAKSSARTITLSDVDDMRSNGFKVSIIEPNAQGEFAMERNANIVYFDITILDAEVVLRGWELGDRINPFGMRGTKKVSDIFTDMKYSAIDKQRAKLLVADGEVVWIAGVRRSIHYPVTAETLLAIAIEVVE